MKKLISLIVLLCVLPKIFLAQQETSKRLAFGLHVNQYQNDFGMGINLTSPYFVNHKMAFRLNAGTIFHQHLEDNLTTWSPYTNVSLGLVGVSGHINKFVTLYGEGGIIGLFPSSSFSSSEFDLGGYGLFGFEFYFQPKSNYFIEIGGVGTGAKADKIKGNPIYSNGVLLKVGFRQHF